MPARQLKVTREWVTPSRAHTARCTVPHHPGTWNTWTFKADPQQNYTDAEFDDLFAVRVGPAPEGISAHGRMDTWSSEDGRAPPRSWSPARAR